VWGIGFLQEEEQRPKLRDPERPGKWKPLESPSPQPDPGLNITRSEGGGRSLPSDRSIATTSRACP